MALIDNITWYWKLNLNSDDSVWTNNWTDTNSPSYSNAWKVGNCVTYNWTNQMTSLWALWTSSQSAYSMSIWINWTSWNGVLWERTYPSPTPNIYSATNRYDFRLYTSGWSIILNCSDQTAPDGWNHYVYTRSTSQWNAKLYRNGWLVRTSSDSVTSNQNLSWTIYLWRSDSSYFWGKIDEMWVWNRVLSNEEISQLYNWWNGITYPFAPAITNNWAGFLMMM